MTMPGTTKRPRLTIYV